MCSGGGAVAAAGGKATAIMDMVLYHNLCKSKSSPFLACFMISFRAREAETTTKEATR